MLITILICLQRRIWKNIGSHMVLPRSESASTFRANIAGVGLMGKV